MHSLSRLPNMFSLPSLFDVDAGWDVNVLRWSPAINVRETQTEFVVEAEIPGIPADQVDVSIVGSTLTLRGEKIREVRRDDKDGRSHLVERSYGSFARSIRLPSAVDTEKTTASAKDGLLTITIAKRDLPRQIKIDVQSN